MRRPAAPPFHRRRSAIQEAVEVYFEGEDIAVPPPTPLDELIKQGTYEDGVWLLVDIDLAKLHPKAVRVNISLPESLVRRIDEYTRARHQTRSGFLAQAAENAMKKNPL